MEGTLEIVWENDLDRTAAPRYKLFFLRYRNFKSGAQRSNLVVGDDGLESYLLDVGFYPERAKACVEQVHSKRHVSINNVMLSDEYLPAYAN